MACKIRGCWASGLPHFKGEEKYIYKQIGDGFLRNKQLNQAKGEQKWA
jgi:hypothetical protein